MILTFDYPEYRKNINDRRLWSEINTNLIFEKKKYDLKNTIVVITIFKRKNLNYPTRTIDYNLTHKIYNKKKYFNIDELKDIINMILIRCNIKFNICNFLYNEQYIYEKPKIKLEFLSNIYSHSQIKGEEECRHQ